MSRPEIIGMSTVRKYSGLTHVIFDDCFASRPALPTRIPIVQLELVSGTFDALAAASICGNARTRSSSASLAWISCSGDRFGRGRKQNT